MTRFCFSLRLPKSRHWVGFGSEITIRKVQIGPRNSEIIHQFTALLPFVWARPALMRERENQPTAYPPVSCIIENWSPQFVVQHNAAPRRPSTMRRDADWRNILITLSGLPSSGKRATCHTHIGAFDPARQEKDGDQQHRKRNAYYGRPIIRVPVQHVYGVVHRAQQIQPCAVFPAMEASDFW